MGEDQKRPKKSKEDKFRGQFEPVVIAKKSPRGSIKSKKKKNVSPELSHPPLHIKSNNGDTEGSISA